MGSIKRNKTRIFKMATGHRLGFDRTGNIAVWFTDLKSLTVERNMMWIGWPVPELGTYEVSQNVRSVGQSLVINIRTSYTDVMCCFFAMLGTQCVKSKNPLW